MKRKRRPYLLLELLLAFMLLSTCMLPLLQNPLKLVSEERNMLEELELSREADLLFADMKRRLYNSEIPREQILNWDQKLDPFELNLGKNYKKKFARELRLRAEEWKKGKSGEDIVLVNAYVVFVSRQKKKNQNTTKFRYEVFVQCKE